MKKIAPLILLLLLTLSLSAQIPPLEHLQLIETAEYIDQPLELKNKLKEIKEADNLTLITFGKSSGVLKEHISLTKADLVKELEITGFKNRYFVVLVGQKAIFYLE